MALLVFLIQVLGPSLMFVNQWRKPHNQFADPKGVWKSLTFKEMGCLGKNLERSLTTVVGTLFLYVIYTIVYNYASSEHENSAKLARLPVSQFWSIVGSVANAASCVFICLAVPIEFFQEGGPTGIVMNALAMLFIFSFDDLTGDAFAYLDTDDSDFQRQLAWYYSLLSHCPVTLSDLIDPSATTAEKLWKISYNETGILQKADSSGPCLTR